MLQLLVSLIVAIVPFGAVILCLKLVKRAQRSRDEALARQIALTDAIHERLGAVVAPVVRKRPWGPWQVDIAVPLKNPETVRAVVAVTHEMWDAHRADDAASLRLVLTPQERAA